MPVTIPVPREANSRHHLLLLLLLLYLLQTA